MRNLKQHPVTLEEIEAALIKEADTIRSEERVGDMRPLLFSLAAGIIKRTGFVTYDLEQKECQ